MIPVGDKHDCSCPLTGRPHSLTSYHTSIHISSPSILFYPLHHPLPGTCYSHLSTFFTLSLPFLRLPSSRAYLPPPSSSSFALFTRTSYATASPNRQLSRRPQSTCLDTLPNSSESSPRPARAHPPVRETAETDQRPSTRPYYGAPPPQGGYPPQGYPPPGQQPVSSHSLFVARNLKG
ncbi:hypothetical protein LZ31DRAFT_40678 [Colletotrichum somersetense]|nr:hypothetical protein LZ31DRAFT_40678 [Colletotrichum somersetense]